MAVTDPFSYGSNEKLMRRMIFVAWTVAALLASPQVITAQSRAFKIHRPLLSALKLLLFSVQSHPTYVWFEQCVMFDAFAFEWQERIYNISSLVALYFAPLCVISKPPPNAANA